MNKTKIKKLAKQIRGVSYKPEDLHDSLDGDSVILLRANNIDDGRINFDDVVFVDKSKVADEQYLRVGDVLICASSGSKQLVGKAASVEFDLPCTFGSFCKVVRPNEGMADYLSTYFQSNRYRRRISELAIGANINNIRNEHIDSLELPVYDSKDSHCITERTRLLQSVIDNRKEELCKLNELVKSRFVEMFGDPCTNLKEWDECALSEKINVVGGYAFKSDQFDEERGIPVLRIGNINMGFFRPTNMVYWREDDNLERYAIYPGDLVMSLTGTVGKNDYGNVCILGDEYEKYYLNQRNAKLEIKEGIDKYFLSQLLKFESIKKQLTGINRGVRQANISNKDILGLIVPIPPMEIQSRFACFVEQIDKLKFIIVVQCCVNTSYTLLYKGSSKDLE